jgi:hypothetical protein
MPAIMKNVIHVLVADSEASKPSTDLNLYSVVAKLDKSVSNYCNIFGTSQTQNSNTLVMKK